MAVRVKCLGWCDEMFESPSIALRFCPACRQKKDHIDASSSKRGKYTAGSIEQGSFEITTFPIPPKPQKRFQ